MRPPSNTESFVFQSHSWDSYRWSRGLLGRADSGKLRFNLTLEILIVDRLISLRVNGRLLMFQSHSWDSYRWSRIPRRSIRSCRPSFNLTLEILIVDRWEWRDTRTLSTVSISLLRFLSLIVKSRYTIRCKAGWFQSHSWDSYRWSTRSPKANALSASRFNLTLEILIVDRASRAARYDRAGRVSISLLRFLSLIARMVSYNRIEMVGVSISLLRFLSLIGG